ncbi:MAG TPA: hypothetical protein VE783_05985 [Candidatus Limnocylindrales bacterium]|nr:hypothetical protein [Candidatus Limnocylindrales bacterium]
MAFIFFRGDKNSPFLKCSELLQNIDALASPIDAAWGRLWRNPLSPWAARLMPSSILLGFLTARRGKRSLERRAQGVNFFQNRVQPLLQLALGPRLGFGPGELCVVRKGATVKISCFLQ